jgi:hypothetical protein
MTATTTTRPGSATAQEMTWTSDRTAAQLNGGKPMTAHAAMQYIRRSWHSDNTVTSPALNQIHIRNRGTGHEALYTGTVPPVADPHTAVTSIEAVILDFRVDVRTGDLLVAALRAAVDSSCPECAVCEPLLQMLATTART